MTFTAAMERAEIAVSEYLRGSGPNSADEIVGVVIASLSDGLPGGLPALKAGADGTWRLVPVVATEAMEKAGRDALRKGGLLPAYTDRGAHGQQPIMEALLGEAWAAMLAAALPVP